MEAQHTSVSCVEGPAPAASLAELSPELLALIASCLPGEKVATSMLSVSKSLFELEQVRATVTALCFKDFRGESSDLDAVETGGCFVVPAASATATLFIARFPKLISANFVGCLNLENAAVVALAGHCPGL
eukprot:CAMPEP_0172602546 /NCGR_PEP_ID=MMETSP1068-20121228/22727_1 /TAXON_ID=35684 /ORGANISM="Pseudopedinella elastica, Strain CCMP716" /LENGTH=130 /DNA_ID=CAMNT_0013403941 /DNA_START=105 /DNA_END=493 /DNA_ORIENTATION=+